ncbi:MAG: ATP-binding protein [bacterium]
MARSSHGSKHPDTKQQDTSGSQKHDLTPIDPNSLLGVGAALAIHDSEEDVARFIGSAVTAVLRVKFGAVALITGDGGAFRVFGQFRDAPLQDSLAKEIEQFLSTSIKKSDAFSGETLREIRVQRERFPNLSAVGFRRLLSARLRTLDSDFGLVLAGQTPDKPYLPVQATFLETLASQTSLALHRLQLRQERKQAEKALQEAHDELEHRVEERTAELANANAMLKAEISEHKQSEVALEQLRRQNELILNSVGEGIYGLDLHGNTTFANPSSARMLGWTAEDLIGKPQHAIVHHTKPDGKPYPRKECPIYAAFKDGSVHRVDTEVFWRKDGTSFPVEYISTPIRDENGELIGAVVTFRDITNRKRAEDALRKAHEDLELRVKERTAKLSEANEQLMSEISERKRVQAALHEAKEVAESANRAKSDFLANMSHELRTPLNGILGYAQILKRDKRLLDAQKAGVDVIERSGNHLLNLINDILDLSKIEAEKLEIQSNDFHLPEFLNDIAAGARLSAEEKGLLFVYKPSSSLPAGVHADEKRLREVLLNLLSNAVKYAEKGEVVFSAGTQKGSAGKTKLRFQVEDTGIGIAPEKLQEIFLPFQQVNVGRQYTEGTGLGLTISRRLVKLMGGELLVKSTPGKGCVFWFELEVTELQDWKRTEAAVERTIVGFRGKKRKILVADDKPENRAVATGFLLPLGFKIAEAQDGKDCLSQATKFKPDLILMDLVMPVMDGFEATRRIRRSAELKDVVVIALSASVFEHNRHESEEAGCDDFIPKPVQFEELLEKLRNHLALDWIYDIESETDGRGKSQEKPLVAPPSEELAVLFELAERGQIMAVRDEIDRIEALGEQFKAFTLEVRRFAKGYQMKQICDLIEPYLNKANE